MRNGTQAFLITVLLYITLISTSVMLLNTQSHALSPPLTKVAVTAAMFNELPEPKPEPDIEQQRAQQAAALAAAEAEVQYTQRLAQHLSRLAQKNYPRMAKRRLQQGNVILQFTLQPNGQIQQLQLIDASNYRLLNEAALDIIRKSMDYQYLPFPSEMPKKPIRIQVPINYILR
ncbi:hypothetical protein CYQ88_07675 [Hydrogenovibrio sp. SC-1]|uniref:energy transducer TonB n=1 Tax=Hydrogenovibrio sp. SC-1 TaxID=2065820 RepID=UPI000C7C1A0B|nr:energy transducer TonB [Hydrogenovibrio sp. SC-1]PLA74111.1 hypothetical protein CYQ88_07675 [Hydrogenovibrio sp. SC-1]